ncbi:hypothetical protein M885DRAFT_529448 [Pelagophyceae sp. CCMP2097]|nr:hypothetical protein M885DRAFT_529448 [Pelagophyceae sp. CCMP2097]
MLRPVIRFFAAGAVYETRCARGARALATYSGSPVKYPAGAHRSNAEQLIGGISVILVDGEGASCDGGGGALGHPIQYLQLTNCFDNNPVPCLYCGLRYLKNPDWVKKRGGKQ